jgi:hypothetical protein
MWKVVLDWLNADVPAWRLALFFLIAVAMIVIIHTNSDHAFEFLGAFLAAIVAAIAVVGNSLYQDRLNRAVELEKLTRSQGGQAIYVWSTLVRATQHVGALSGGLKASVYTNLQNPPSAQDYTLIPVAVYRAAAKAHDFDFDGVGKAASTLPPRLAGAVIAALTRLETSLISNASFPFMSDDQKISRANIEAATTALDGARQHGDVVQQLLHKYLKEREYLF